MKVVYDTGLYIDLLRSSSRLELFTAREHTRYLPAVVMMELLAGVRNPRQKRIVDSLIAPYSKAGRIVSLNAPLHYKAGETLAASFRQGWQIRSGYINDVLIALSAFSCGAVLYTGNRRDFQQIAKTVPVRLEFV